MYSGLISRNLSEAFIYIPYENAFGEKQWLLSTKISSTGDASKIFPCWFDDGSTKTTFELSLRHNREHTALSNTRRRLSALSPTDYNNEWTIFEKTPLLFPQQLAFIIGNFERSTHYDEAYRVWTLTDADNNYEYISIIGGKIWSAMKNLTGITNHDKIIKNFDFVILHNVILPQVNPFYSYGILITNNEIVTFIKNNSEILKPKTKLHQQISFSICMQWYPFYNFQSNNDNDVFLNYGVIAYLVAATTDQFYESPYAVEKIIHQVSDSRDLDLTIIKILHIIGETNLRNLLHNLAVESHLGVLETNYLLQKYSKILGVNILRMMEILGNLLLTEGYPVVNVTRDYSRHSVTVRQKRFLKNPSENSNEKYWIPLNYATKNNPNFDDTTVTRWINPDSNKIVMSVAATNDQWIICNKQLIENHSPVLLFPKNSVFQVSPAIIPSRHTDDFDLKNIYTSIENLLDRYKWGNGRQCLLKSICELAETPLSKVNSDILVDVVHLLLTPTEDLPEKVNSSHRTIDKLYRQAELLGRSGGDCTWSYPDCIESPLKSFTQIVFT
ncbi:aminopeptidase N [Microplitis demolitor]|uniref:aminopeptidase N n=1 Tax=Microplitis demolitor TaxID=69319 RepID=UPI00235B6417|nr:aminopeptidase N [Microplitis demolitor]